HHAHGIVKALREELPKRPGFPVVILLCGNKEKESQEILKEGLAGLDARVEIYDREHVYDAKFIGGRVKALVVRSLILMIVFYNSKNSLNIQYSIENTQLFEDSENRVTQFFTRKSRKIISKVLREGGLWNSVREQSKSS
ncbi:MAG: hypothetical protein JRJ50_13325, partial [Deltaproteobacteria bacterium]|nr:hypothetical protein [Deltaproteobacteria bacterium]